MTAKWSTALLAGALLVLASFGMARADMFTMDRYSDVSVLVSGTFYSKPDVNALNWDDASHANVVTHGGWGTVPGAQWISELTRDVGPAGSYRVFHLEITLPANSENLTGRLDYMVDDYLWFYVNQDLAAENTTYGNWNRLRTIDFTSSLAPGLTSVVLDLVVRNYGSRGQNPLGASFHVTLSGDIADVGAAAPEPGTFLLLGTALAGLWGRRIRSLRKKRAA